MVRTKVRFWEYNWLGSSSLAIQYWKLYRIVNEKNMTMAEIWDGENLKCTFTRTVDSNLEEQWWEVVQLASTINFSEEEDSLVWLFASNGIYSFQSLYMVVRGIKPIFVSAIWSLKIPPRVQCFLWLLSKNKVLTRDNLSKRRKVEDTSCLFLL